MMKRSQQYLKFANLTLLVVASTIAIVDIGSFVLLILPDVLKFDVFIGWLQFYPVLTNYIFPISMASIIAVLIGYFAIIITYAWFTKEQPNMRFGSINISLVIFVNLLLCPCSFAWLLIQPSSSILQRITLDNRIYHLHIRTYDPAENQFFYHLSECDSLDFICKEIYSDEQYWLEQKVGFIKEGAEKLLADPAAHTVRLQINGETVYVHPVK